MGLGTHVLPPTPSRTSSSPPLCSSGFLGSEFGFCLSAHWNFLAPVMSVKMLLLTPDRKSRVSGKSLKISVDPGGTPST